MYLSGPISGMPNNNQEVFDRAEAFWRSQGWAVINPLKLPDPTEDIDDAVEKFQRTHEELSWILWVMKGITYMLKADAICLLEGWEESYGSMIEAIVANKLGFNFWFQEIKDDFGDWFEKQMEDTI